MDKATRDKLIEDLVVTALDLKRRVDTLEGHTVPHLNDNGGCLCKCPLCVKPIPDRIFGRCICPQCNEECPTDRLDQPEVVPSGYVPAPPTEESGVIRLPGQPPTERRVRAVGDGPEYVWIRTRDGSWYDRDGRSWGWGEILEHSDVEIVPLTPEEEAEAELYGPPGARWGSIGTPCPYSDCMMWAGHIGPHRDFDGNALGVVDETPMAARLSAGISPHTASQDPCNCGRPSQHRPGCNRYNRLTGGQP